MTKIDVQFLHIQYCKIMEEIKDRLRIIERIYRAEFELPPTDAIELCYLELRMICELIALACLTAHGDMPDLQTRKVREAYEPGKILTELGRLHKSFYPIPVGEKLDAEKDLESITPIRNDSLTKSQLVRLHADCGAILHRGAFHRFGPRQAPDFIKAASWQRKIVALLNRHIIAMSDRKRLVYITMQDKITKSVTLSNLMIKDASHWPSWFDELGK